MTGLPFSFAGAQLVADASGALYWPAERTLMVADLHFEKGSSFAARGTALLPPYDTRATLQALEQVIRRYRPARVICLGDSFHDLGAVGRLSASDQTRLGRVVGAQDWLWISGNHDPQPPAGLGGDCRTQIRLGGLVLRHEPEIGAQAPMPSGEVSGHYHPKARVRLRTRGVSGRCFVTDGRRLVLPSFGAFTGGLDVLDPAFAAVIAPQFRIYLLARDNVYAFRQHQLSVPPERLAG